MAENDYNYGSFALAGEGVGNFIDTLVVSHGSNETKFFVIVIFIRFMLRSIHHGST